MKYIIADYLGSLNSVNVETSLLIFRNCFRFLSLSFTKLTIEQLEDWINQLGDSKLDQLWVRQKELQYPSFILFYGVQYFRDKTLREGKYQRIVHEKRTTINKSSDQEIAISNEINRKLDELSPFEGVEFLGSLIGAWMLTCPREVVLSETDTIQIGQPNEIWLKSVFPDTLGHDMSSDELELLYKLDYRLYRTFEDMEEHYASS